MNRMSVGDLEPYAIVGSVDGLMPTAKVGPFETLAASSRIREYSRGECICEAGISNSVGYVVEGAVKLVNVLPDGHSNIVGVIEAPGFFGGLFGVTAQFTVEAATDVVVACFDQATFEAQMAASAELEHFVHLQNLRQLDDARERILVLGCQSTIGRMATFMVLRMLSVEARSAARLPAETIINVLLNRRDFASYLGTTVETISRNLQALSRRGTIEIIDNANFRVLRRNDLFRIAGQDEDDLTEMVKSRGPAASSLAAFFQPFRRPRLVSAATRRPDPHSVVNAGLVRDKRLAGRDVLDHLLLQHR